MTKNIFFDLDGTLLDCSQRLYDLFCELVPESRLSFEEYWEIKRKRIDQKKLLSEWFGYSDKEIVNFKKIWLQKVEDESRLNTDFPFEKSSELLEELSKNYKLYIVTNRQSKDKAEKQIIDLGLSKYLTKILVTEQKKTKLELIKENVKYSSGDILVSDTGEDILIGKKLGIRTVGVSSGFMNEEILQEYKPDAIFKDIKAIYESNSL